MNDKTLNPAGRASVADLQTLAAQGVQRALDARAQGMSELSAEQAQAVSGGAQFYIINGRFAQLAATAIAVNPAVSTTFNAGNISLPSGL